MSGTTIHFLLVYSHSEQKLLESVPIVDRDDATQAYNAAEARYRGRSDEFEIVLVGADSIDTVMKTHGHYFGTVDDTFFQELLTDSV